MPRRSSSYNLLQRIPEEVVVYEVLGRLAASSLTDLFNLKSSCKVFNEMTEDKYIYQCISLKKFPMVSWNPSMEKNNAFLNKCRESQNPEAMYRQAVLDYFNRSDIRSARTHLLKAAKLGHLEAPYLRCIMLLLGEDEESRRTGIGMLAGFRGSGGKLRLWRHNLLRKLRAMWVKNRDLLEPRKCCPNSDQHRWRNRVWCEDDEWSECEACFADSEIKRISGTYNGL